MGVHQIKEATESMDQDDKLPQIVIKIDPEHLKVIDNELKRLVALLTDDKADAGTKQFAMDRMTVLQDSLRPDTMAKVK